MLLITAVMKLCPGPHALGALMEPRPGYLGVWVVSGSCSLIQFLGAASVFAEGWEHRSALRSLLSPHSASLQVRSTA